MKRFPFLRCIAFAGILLSGIPCRGEVPQTLSYQGRVSVNGINFSGTGQFKFALVDAGQNQNQTATANAFATLMLTSITVVSGGSGYVDAPVVTISPPDDPEGVQATATATIEGGIVTGISIIAAGSGYFNHPQVTIAPPPPNVVHQIYWSNSGDLAPGEVPGTSVSLPVVNGLYSVRLGDNSLPNMAAFFVPEIFYTPLYLRVWFDDGVHGLQQLTPDQPLSSAPYAMHSRLAETVPPGSIGAFQLANGAVSSFKLADGSVTPAKIADASIPASKLATPTAPAAGQMLRFDGTQFVWSPDGLALPFAGAATTSNAAFSIQNNSNGAAIEANGTAGDGLKALTGGSGKSAVFGQNNTFTGGGQGVYGYGFFNATGVLGVSNGGDGVHGKTEGTGKSGVFGLAIGPNSSGVHGASDLHHGVYAATGSADRAAIWAWAPNGAEAMHGHSVAGDGVVGYTAKDIINIAPGGGFFIPTMESRKAGVHGWTDKLYGLGGRFVNTNGGTALFVSGASNLSGNVTVSGNLLVTGSLTLNGGSSLPPIFGQGTTSYVPHMLVCGTYNNAAQFPSGGATPLFQVGNGSNGAPSNAFSVLNNGDVYVQNFFRAGQIGATNYYGANVYAENDVTAERVLSDSITIGTIETYKPGGGTWLPTLSDGRFKDVQSEYRTGLDSVCKIRPVRYKYKASNPDGISAEKEYLGVIAQEVQVALPEAIITRDDGYLTVDIDKINWAAINAIKELKAENDALRARLDAIEAKLK